MAISVKKEQDSLRTWFGGALSDDELTDIGAFLRGEVKRDSKREKTARRALARAELVGEPLPQDVRWLLAERYDPDDGEIGFVIKPTRRRGRPKTQAKGWEIAEIVERRIRAGDKVKQACGYAEDAFGIKKRTVEKAHKQHKDQIRALGGAKIITSID
jgi:hypothetical protein